jgi:hypothetical protein
VVIDDGSCPYDAIIFFQNDGPTFCCAFYDVLVTMVLLKILDGLFGIVGWIANIDCVVYQLFNGRQIDLPEPPYLDIFLRGHFSIPV